MSDKKECRGCIGFDEAHTCDDWAQFQIMKKEKDKCRACEAKGRRIAELEKRLVANERAIDSYLNDETGVNAENELLQADNERLRAALEELEADNEYVGAAAWILEWMLADKYRKPETPAVIESARNHYRDTLAENERLRAALDKLARLGNEPHYGNSDGNVIAQRALAAVEETSDAGKP